MGKKFLKTDIPIRSVVIAWQPAFLPPDDRSAAPGQVGVFEHLDPRDGLFLMTHGACYAGWAEQPVEELIQELLWLKKEIVREYGIAAWLVEGMFRRIREFRLYRVAQCRRTRPRGRASAKRGPADI